MKSLQSRSFRQAGHAVGWIFVLVGLLTFLFIPVPTHTALWRAINNFAHLPLFGIVGLVLLHLLRMMVAATLWSPIRQYLVAMLGVLGLALLTEALQSLSATRHPEWSDVLHDLGGALCGLGVFLTYDPWLTGSLARWRQFPRNAIVRGWVFVVVGIALVPTMGWAYAYWDRAQRFPSILQFSSSWELKFVKASNSAIQVVEPPQGWRKSAEDQVGKVEFYPQKYPGIRIEEPYPDWRGLTSFQLDVFSELQNPQSVVIRIDDAHHNNDYTDRFNQAFTIVPGLNHIEIPLERIRQAPLVREMDLSALKSIIIFAVNPPKAFSLYVDNFRLE